MPERTLTLAPQAWMARPGAGKVMDALVAAGGEGCARFVGGCVRNALLRRDVGDIDIATTLSPTDVAAAITRAGLKAVPTGLAHGTITAVAGGCPFEITTLRRDVETDGRRAKVEFTDDWTADAMRRDFRLNALYADREGRLWDPTRGGVDDVLAGRIVFVGEPEARIAEDALRILRFFRFFAWYGRGEPDAAALAACREMRERVRSLSAERIAKELLALFAADDPRAAVRLMQAAGVLAEVLPQADGVDRFEALVCIETEFVFAQDALMRLAALLPPDAATARSVAGRLRLSNAQRDRLVAALGEGPRLVSWMSPKQVRQEVWRVGSKTFCDRVMLAWAASDRPAAAVQWRALLPMAQSWRRPRFPLNGREVQAAGVAPGPMVGKVLAEVQDWWIDNDFPSDKLSLIERLKAVVQGMAQ